MTDHATHPQGESAFLDLLSRRFRLERLEGEPGTTYGLWPDLRLAYLNPAWFAFAAANGGEPAISARFGLGRALPEAVQEPLRGYYTRKLTQALASGEVWTHDYECSSAIRFRKFHQQVFPLDEGAGLLVLNSLRVEEPHDPAQRPSCPPLRERYASAQGLIVQCCHCRRVRRAEAEQWDWVPDWVERMPEGVSHGICAHCLDYYYPELHDR